MKQPRSFFFVLTLVLIVSCFVDCLATHSGNRFFYFLERPESYVTQGRSYISPQVFFSKSSTTFKRYGGRGGLPELWGRYDLKDVITSLQTVKGDSYDPIYEITGTDELDGVSLRYKLNGEIETAGFMLEFEQNLKAIKLRDFTVGFWVPVYHMSMTSEFSFDSSAYYNSYHKTLSQAEIVTVDKIRQLTHKDIGIKGTNLNRGGFGDLDMFVRWNYHTDYACWMRSIDANFQVGVIAPTGPKMNIDYPSSVPFMNNGHWGLYFDVVPEFELKQDWKFGLMLGLLDQFSASRTMRLAVGMEPTTYSALVGKIKEDPGLTYKFSAYFTLENLTDGLNLQLRYTYLRHEMDKWFDKRSDQTISSYLERDRSSAGLTQQQMDANYSLKSQLSKWRAHYFTFQAVYDSKDGLKNWFMHPKFFASYDLPMNGRGICKNHQFTLGAQLSY